jgi:hypothetical protein
VIVRYDELLADPVLALSRLRGDLAALGVPSSEPMSHDELRAWLPPLDAFDAALYNTSSRGAVSTRTHARLADTLLRVDANSALLEKSHRALSPSQRRLARAFASGAQAVSWVSARACV